MSDPTGFEAAMADVVRCLNDELAVVRTGRANPSLVDTILVSYYGALTPLKQMASVTAPDVGTIVIAPWDKQALADIETAIRASNLGMSPVNEGVQIRLTLPPLTQERRDELAKSVRRVGEAAKVAVRAIRKQAWDDVQRRVKGGELTEDDKYRWEQDLNKVIERYNRTIDAAVADKEKEVRTV